jgi:tartrate-resistant acid phosphatase type 5
MKHYSAIFLATLAMAFVCTLAAQTAKTMTFAIIGDFGSGNTDELAVRDLVNSMHPQFVVTVGDNSYDDDIQGALARNDSIYNKYIREGRFYPCPGNHDHKKDAYLAAYKKYFGVSKNYRILKGNCYLYFLDSGGESDGGSFDQSTTDTVIKWLRSDTGSYFHILVFHHPPYSQGRHGCNLDTRLDYTKLNVDVVLSGHDHMYERIYAKNTRKPLFIVDGSGGAQLDAKSDNPKSNCKSMFDLKSYDDKDFGAVKAVVSGNHISFQYYTVKNPKKPFDIALVTKKM